jgi:hypothetical protein
VKSPLATSKRKGRAGGAAMMAWMFFANLFEPKKVAAMENIDTQRRIGSEALRNAATPAAPPGETEAR